MRVMLSQRNGNINVDFFMVLYICPHAPAPTVYIQLYTVRVYYLERLLRSPRQRFSIQEVNKVEKDFSVLMECVCDIHLLHNGFWCWRLIDGVILRRRLLIVSRLCEKKPFSLWPSGIFWAARNILDQSVSCLITSLNFSESPAVGPWPFTRSEPNGDISN